MPKECEVCGKPDDYCSHCGTCHSCLEEERDNDIKRQRELKAALSAAMSVVERAAAMADSDAQNVLKTYRHLTGSK